MDTRFDSDETRHPKCELSPSERNAVQAREAANRTQKPRPQSARQLPPRLEFGKLLGPLTVSRSKSPTVPVSVELRTPMRPGIPLRTLRGVRRPESHAETTLQDRGQTVATALSPQFPQLAIAVSTSNPPIAGLASRIVREFESGTYERDLEGNMTFRIDLAADILAGARVTLRRVDDGQIEIIVDEGGGSSVDPRDLDTLVDELERQGLRTTLRKR